MTRPRLLASISIFAVIGALVLYSQSTLVVGYAVVTAESGSRAPVGSVLFSYSNNDGVLVSQAGVGGTEPIRAGRIFVDQAGTQTGVVLVNNSAQPVSAALTLRDAQGNEIAGRVLPLGPREHWSRYVQEIFPSTPPGFIGTLTFQSDTALTALTLRESRNSRGEPLYTTLPVVDLSARSNDALTFPQIAAGGGYTTQLLLINRSAERIRGQVRLVSDDGTPLPLELAGTVVTSFPYQLEPNGVYRAELQNSAGLAVGYGVATPEAGSTAPDGTAIFQLKTAGQIVTEAGVPATTETTLARIFVDYAGSQTGLAVANRGTSAGELTFTLMDRFGERQDSTTRTIPAGGHTSIFVRELFNSLPLGFTGLLEIRSSTPIAPLTLKLTTNARSETVLTTLPVADLTRLPSATTLVFPHLVLGSGFTTRVIFIQPDVLNTASGFLRFYREDGSPMVTPLGGSQLSEAPYQLSPGSARQFLPGNTARLASVVLLDTSNEPTTELTINEGSRARPRLLARDSTGAFRDDFDLSYSSSNTDVAGIQNGIVTGGTKGFSTLRVSNGTTPFAFVITVTGVESGSGYSGFSPPTGIAQDAAQRLYLASTDQHTVLRARSASEPPSIYAGKQQVPGLKNDLPLESLFDKPSFLAVDRLGGFIYISDSANNVIRRIRTGLNERVEPLAGTGAPGSSDGIRDAASFRNPQGLALDDRGQLWVADSGNHTIRRINLATGRVDTVAGEAGSAGFADGAGGAARFHSPTGLVIEPEPVALQLERQRRGQAPPSVRIIVADAGNGVLRRVREEAGRFQVETLGRQTGLTQASRTLKIATAANMANPASLADGSAYSFRSPTDVTADASGTLYVSEPDSKHVRAVLPTGDVVDAAQATTFTKPKGILVSEKGTLIVADSGLQQVRYGEPRIISITPDRVSARGGEKIVIHGTNFAPGSFIIAGEVIMAASNINSSESDTENISLTLPPLPSGRTTLTVQNRGGLTQKQLLVDPIPLSQLPVGSITTVLGGSTFAGDGGPAKDAVMLPQSIAVDTTGNLFIADSVNHRIRRVDVKTGIITSIAGNGINRYSEPQYEENVPAIAASLSTPLGIALDGAGNLFIADSYNQRVRRVDLRTGLIVTVAGTGADGYSGDGVPAVQSNLNLPSAVAVDPAGNLYIADAMNHRIRRVDRNGIIETAAGTGKPVYAGDNGPAGNASVNEPFGVFADNAGNLFIADTGNRVVRKIDTKGIITTVVGSGQEGLSEDGTPALGVRLRKPWGVAVDLNGNILLADLENCVVQRVSSIPAAIRTVAGISICDFQGDGGAATAARISYPTSVAVDGAGNILIADSANRRVRRVDVNTGIISTLAGKGDELFLGDNGPAAFSIVNSPYAIAFDNDGNLAVADTYHHRVRKMDRNTGVITTIAGGGTPPDGLGDGGRASDAYLSAPFGIGYDRSGNLFIADSGHHRVRRVAAASQIITTIAGTGDEGFNGEDIPALTARLSFPTTLIVNGVGDPIVAVEGDRRIRKIDMQTGLIRTIAGDGSSSPANDGELAQLSGFSRVAGFTLDNDGNIYIPDYENGRIRRVDAFTQVLTTIAGGGMRFYDNPVRAFEAALLPYSLAHNGRLFVYELFRASILKIDSTGLMTIVAGNGKADYSGDNGPAVFASVSFPYEMVFDRSGNLFIADVYNNRIRAVRGPIP